MVGVSSWRRGCGLVGGLGRPRLYDKVSPAAEWANKVINKVNKCYAGTDQPTNQPTDRHERA